MTAGAFVTGGLGGLGRAICRKLASEGLGVCFSHRPSKEENALKFAEELACLAPEAVHRAIPLDLSLPIDGKELRDRLQDASVPVECLVNCAGTTSYVPHDKLDLLHDELIDDILAVNVKAPIALTRELLPLLRQGRNSCVINITSVAARIANGSNVVYCASKSALDSITRSLARALAPEIRLFSIAPGLMDTGFIRSPSESWYMEQIERTPLKKLVRPESVATAVFFAYRDMLDATGTVLEIDGGRPLA